MASALVVPVLLLLLGLAFPTGLLLPPNHADLLALLHNPLVRGVLLALCVLSLLHWAHRFRYTCSTAYSSSGCGHRSICVLRRGGAGSVWAAIVLFG